MKVLLFAVSLLLTACAGTRISTDFDTSYNFSSVKTYAWLSADKKIVADPYVDNDLMLARVHRSIDQQMLQAKLKKVSSADSADILLSYHLSSHQKISSTNYGDHFGYYPCSFCGPNNHHYGHDTKIRQYREGSFMVNLIDPKTKKLVWRGVNERRLPVNATPIERDLFVSKVIQEIFHQSPLK